MNVSSRWEGRPAGPGPPGVLPPAEGCLGNPVIGASHSTTFPAEYSDSRFNCGAECSMRRADLVGAECEGGVLAPPALNDSLAQRSAAPRCSTAGAGTTTPSQDLMICDSERPSHTVACQTAIPMEMDADTHSTFGGCKRGSSSPEHTYASTLLSTSAGAQRSADASVTELRECAKTFSSQNIPVSDRVARCLRFLHRLPSPHVTHVFDFGLSTCLHPSCPHIEPPVGTTPGLWVLSAHQPGTLSQFVDRFRENRFCVFTIATLFLDLLMLCRWLEQSGLHMHRCTPDSLVVSVDGRLLLGDLSAVLPVSTHSGRLSRIHLVSMVLRTFPAPPPPGVFTTSLASQVPKSLGPRPPYAPIVIINGVRCTAWGMLSQVGSVSCAGGATVDPGAWCVCLASLRKRARLVKTTFSRTVSKLPKSSAYAICGKGVAISTPREKWIIRQHIAGQRAPS